MTQLPTNGSIEVRPQPNVYTVLLIVAILVMLVTIGFVAYKLTSDTGYGLTVGQLFKPFEGVKPCLLYTSPSPRDRS